MPEGHGEPLKKLVGFQKVTLEPGESREVEIVIDPLDVTHPLALWDGDGPAGLWRTISGVYTVLVGTSSQDLPLRATFEVRAKEALTTSGSDMPYLYATSDLAGV